MAALARPAPPARRRALVAGFALAVGCGLLLHLGTGLADQGDFARSTSFLLERSEPPGETAAGADPREARLARWQDRWILRDRWKPRWAYNASSYKLLLAAQVAFDRAVTGDRRYSMRLGSLPVRAALTAAYAGLLALALAEAPLWGALLFALLAGAAAVDASFAAFLNSAYEDQVALVLLPVLALLLWRAAARPGRRASLGAAAAAALVGASKAQLAYLPLLAAPFLWRALRAAPLSRGAAAALLLATQALALAPLAVNPAARVNVYHAAYRGLLLGLDPAELAAARLGGEPVLRECLGVGAFAPGGRACVARARHGYADLAALAVAHPRATVRLLGRALALGPDVGLAYLGKTAPGARSFADLPVFGGWRVVFEGLGVALVAAAALAGAWLARHRASLARARGAADAALLLVLLGTTQYGVALADGLVEYPKHVLVGNFALALALSLAAVVASARTAPDQAPATRARAPAAATA